MYLSDLETDASGIAHIDIPLSDLCEQLDIGRASLYRAFGKLCEAGLIEQSARCRALLQRVVALKQRKKDELRVAEARHLADEIDGWIIDTLHNMGCDTAKSVLEMSAEVLAKRADLEIEQAEKIIEILKAEFEE